MSLADLWTAHSVRRSTQLTVSTDASAHNKQSSSSYTASASRQAKRKRLAESIQTREVPKVQSETARKPVRSFAPGETDLGSGSVIIVKPKVFRHDDSQELYKSLKVFSSEFAFDISGGAGQHRLLDRDNNFPSESACRLGGCIRKSQFMGRK